MPFSSQHPSETNPEKKGGHSQSVKITSTRSQGAAGTLTNLTRHGSLRRSKNPVLSELTKSSKPFAAFTKPFQKSKQTFLSTSKSVDGGDKSVEKHFASKGSNTEEFKKHPNVPGSQSQQDVHSMGKEVSFHDMQLTSLDTISLGSERSQTAFSKSSLTTVELAHHLRRLTEEHEKLQVEYARLRTQLLENAASHLVSYHHGDLQHLSHSDSHLASIPENGSSSGTKESHLAEQVQAQEAIIQGYRAEVLRLQNENRKIQRKYWEQVMNSDSIEEELGGASQQVIDLIDKLEEKQQELNETNKKIHAYENQLGAKTFDLQQSQDALQDYQLMLEEANYQKNMLEKKLKDTLSDFADTQENIDFLQAERTAMSEALQETEQSLATLKSEKEKDSVLIRELLDRCRRLYVKVQDKTLQVQLLQAELDSTQGRARDMLLSQGAELTMAALFLSQVFSSVNSILTSVIDFSSTHLELQNKILEEVMSNPDDIDKEMLNGLLFSPNGIDDKEKLDNLQISSSSEKNQDISIDKGIPKPKQLLDFPPDDNYDSPLISTSSSGSDHALSFVQAIIQSIEQSTEKDRRDFSCISTQDESIKSNEESENKAISLNNSDGESLQKPKSEITPSKEIQISNKPVGMAMPIRPSTLKSQEIPNGLHSQNEEQNRIWSDDSMKNGSLDSQLKQVNILLSKLVKVIGLMQDKYLSTLKSLKEENEKLIEDMKSRQKKEGQLEEEIHTKDELLEKSTVKVSELSDCLKQINECHQKEKEDLNKKIEELLEKNHSLQTVNTEQSRQLKEEVKKLVETSVSSANSTYWVDAITICDKLMLKQEITKLKDAVAYKEQLLQNLAQKFARNKAVLEENYQKVVSEVQHLDSVIEKAVEILQSIPDISSSSEPLCTLYNLLSKGSLSESIPNFDGSQIDKNDIVLV